MKILLLTAILLFQYTCFLPAQEIKYQKSAYESFEEIVNDIAKCDNLFDDGKLISNTRRKN